MFYYEEPEQLYFSPRQQPNRRNVYNQNINPRLSGPDQRTRIASQRTRRDIEELKNQMGEIYTELRVLINNDTHLKNEISSLKMTNKLLTEKILNLEKIISSLPRSNVMIEELNEEPERGGLPPDSNVLLERI